MIGGFDSHTLRSLQEIDPLHIMDGFLYNGGVVKQFIKKSDKRVIFPQSEQRDFLKRVARISKLSWLSIAEEIGVHQRTFFDWRREKYSVSLGSLKKMCKIANLPFPSEIEIRKPFWSVKKAAKIGGYATYKKYGRIGSPEVRRKKWLEWWEKRGKNNLNEKFTARKINCPKKSADLAEFVGIIMGDGSITKRQVKITLNSITDKEYCIYVKSLIEKIFQTKPSMNKRRNESTINLTISRTNLVNYCRSIGLLVGNKIKQNLDIPHWVKKNNNLIIPCLRGLMDTDGCLFLECHKVRGKIYSYPRLSLVSASPNLRFSVLEALTDLGFSAKIRNNRNVQIEKDREIRKYFDTIGTSNPKHRRKFEAFLGGVG